MDPHRALPPVTGDAALLPWLLQALAPMSRSGVKQLLQRGCAHVNGQSTTRHDHLLQPGDRVTITSRGPAATQGPAKARLPIAFEDASLAILDKPAGLLSVATQGERDDTAYGRLKEDLERRRAGRPFVVHRLDRDTSGLLLFAKSEAVRERLQANWATVEKTYLAVVEGAPPEAVGTVENWLREGNDLKVRIGREEDGAKLARTRYRSVAHRGRFSLLEVGLETGRKHQIRVHLAGLGCPVTGDPRYGAEHDPARRLGLHAWRLRLDHPATGERLSVEAPLPESLAKLV